mmetsp:Transcript_1738/g.4130  ORF Transcript_1738/g.4130 Transcript_1738/m.4130 type:complete len:258 (-) Transcript_1738:108-881(-)
MPSQTNNSVRPAGLSSGLDLIALFVVSAILIILLQVLTARWIRSASTSTPSPGSSTPEESKDRSDLHLRRRIQHASTGLAFVSLSYLIPPLPAAIMLLTVAAALLALHRLRLRSDAAQEIYMKLFGALLRPHERTSLPGAFYFVLGTAISLAFPLDMARLSVLCLSLGDPVAAIVGTTVGGPRFFGDERTSWSGSLACFAISFVLGVGVMGFDAMESSVAAISATLAEAFAPRIGIDDNLLVPIATCLGLWLYASDR